MSETAQRPRADRSALLVAGVGLAFLVLILLGGGSFFAGPGFLFAMLGMLTMWLLPFILVAAILVFVFRPVLDRRQEVVRVRCRACRGLNPEDAAYCGICGDPV